MSDICKLCGKDHNLINTGPLTECEARAYASSGAMFISKGKKILGFGGGERFQFNKFK